MAKRNNLAFDQDTARLCPKVFLIDASGGASLSFDTAVKITAAVQGVDRLLGVYFRGGGNTAIFNALMALDLQPDLFIGYGLDRKNQQLLHQN